MYGDAGGLLEPVEQARDAVAVLVGLDVTWLRVLAVGLGWYYRNNAAQQQIDYLAPVVTSARVR